MGNKYVNAFCFTYYNRRKCGIISSDIHCKKRRYIIYFLMKHSKEQHFCIKQNLLNKF
jgi:hypothetical protein